MSMNGQSQDSNKQAVELLTRQDIQRILGISRGTASQLILDGAFPNAAKVGHTWRVPKSDIDAYLAANRVKPQAQEGGAHGA